MHSINISIFDEFILAGMGETLLKRYSLLREIDNLVLTKIGLSISILVLTLSTRRTIDLHINLNLVILLRIIKLINRDSISIQVDHKSVRYQTEAWNQLKDFKSSQGLSTDQIFNRIVSLFGRLSIMQIDLSIYSTHRVLFQAIKNAFNRNRKELIRLSPRRISSRKINSNTISLFNIMLSKINILKSRQRTFFRKTLRIMSQRTMRIFRIFILSIEKEIILIASTRKSFY